METGFSSGDSSPKLISPRTPTVLLPNDGDVEWDCSLNSLAIPSSTFNQKEPSPNRLYRKVYMKDREELRGNCALGQLTQKGLEQHLLLASQYKTLYIDNYTLIPQELNEDYIWVRSTDIPRTVQSAMAELEGLYPPQHSSDGNIGIIPIRTMDNSLEDMVANPTLCPRINSAEAQLKNTTEWHHHQASIQPLVEKLKAIFNTSQLPSFSALADALLARQCHKLPLPHGVNDAVVKEIQDVANWEMNYFWTDNFYGQITMGFFLGELVEVIEKRVQDGVKLPNYYLYSGHDSTVGPLSATLGAFDGYWPPYCSHIEIELWADEGETNFFVQFKYNGKVALLKGCSDEMCPYSQFKAFATSRIPTNYAHTCHQQ